MIKERHADSQPPAARCRVHAGAGRQGLAGGSVRVTDTVYCTPAPTSRRVLTPEPEGKKFGKWRDQIGKRCPVQLDRPRPAGSPTAAPPG